MSGRPARSTMAPIWLAVIALVVVVADQGSKAWASGALSGEPRIPILGGLLGLQLIFNSGAAFSLGSGSTWIFTIVAGAVVALVLVKARTMTSRSWALALGLLLGGAIGNLIDRLFRAPGFGRGHVVDFIAYGDAFIGNIADVAIVLAAVLMILLVLRGVAFTQSPGGEANDD